ncbi:MAG: hypothetical protein HY660_01650 [Armatimonadetes bacterium]|nr:hypothetical protein [Armatimonadota bacterium]
MGLAGKRVLILEARLGQVMATDAQVAVGAIGPVARHALEAQGIQVTVEPGYARMAPLVHALDAYFKRLSPPPTASAAR